MCSICDTLKWAIYTTWINPTIYSLKDNTNLRQTVLWNLFKSLIDKKRIKIRLYDKVLSWNWLVNINDLIESLPNIWYTT